MLPNTPSVQVCEAPSLGTAGVCPAEASGTLPLRRKHCGPDDSRGDSRVLRCLSASDADATLDESFDFERHAFGFGLANEFGVDLENA